MSQPKSRTRGRSLVDEVADAKVTRTTGEIARMIDGAVLEARRDDAAARRLLDARMSQSTRSARSLASKVAARFTASAEYRRAGGREMFTSGSRMGIGTLVAGEVLRACGGSTRRAGTSSRRSKSSGSPTSA